MSSVINSSLSCFSEIFNVVSRSGEIFSNSETSSAAISTGNPIELLSNSSNAELNSSTESNSGSAFDPSFDSLGETCSV